MIIREKTDLKTLTGDFVKLAVDIERKVLSAGCSFHVDCADELVADGSDYGDVWGANIYPADGKIDYDSLINIRPLKGNRSIIIENLDIRQKVEEVIRSIF